MIRTGKDRKHRRKQRQREDKPPESAAMSRPTEAGAGGGFEIETIQDVRMVERAVTGKWQIPVDAFADAPLRMHQIAKSSTSERAAIAATRALNSMLQTNIGETETADLMDEATIAEEERRLGIEPTGEDEFK